MSNHPITLTLSASDVSKIIACLDCTITFCTNPHADQSLVANLQRIVESLRAEYLNAPIPSVMSLNPDNTLEPKASLYPSIQKSPD